MRWVTAGTLAILYVLLQGDFTPTSALLGGLFGLLVALVMPNTSRRLSPEVNWRKLPGLIGFFFWDLLLSNLRVAQHVLQLRSRIQPAILAVPLEATSDLEVAALSNLVCLTPGTLTIDVSTDRQTLYVHVLDSSEPEERREELRRGILYKVREVCCR